MSDKRNQSNGLVRFLLFIWKVLKAYFISVGVFWTLIPAIFIFLLFSKAEKPEIVSKAPVAVMGEHYVSLSLSGVFTEQEQSSREQVLLKIFGNQVPTYLYSFLQKIEDISNTEHIKGVLVRVSALSISAVNASVLAKAFDDLSQKGKKVWFHSADYDDLSYLIASSGTIIALTPGGQVSLLGTTISSPYFGDALSKLGVGVDVVKTGKYKSAFEPFTANMPSEPTVLMYKSLIEDLSNHYVEKISSKRAKGNTDLVKEWIENSFYTSNAALKEGIVDQIVHYDEFKASIEKSLRTNNDESVKFKPLEEVSTAQIEDYKDVDTGFKIGLLEYSGEIQMQEGDEGVIYPDMVRRDVNWLLKQDEIKAVVMRINSPGGSALASELIWNELTRLKKKIPLVASMGSVAASGGFYMATAADKIVASPETITGSIGVVGLIFNLKAFEEKYGLSFHLFSKSKRRSLLNPGEALSKEDRENLQLSIDEVYDLFLKRVSDARNMGKNAVHEQAQGRVWSGAQALNVGLIDAVGDLSRAYDLAKGLGGLDDGKVYPVIRPNTSESFIDCLKKGGMQDCFDNELNLRVYLKQLVMSHQERRVYEDLSKALQSYESINKSPMQARLYIP